MERKSFTPGPSTFEEDVLGALWKEPYLFETHTRESLQAELKRRADAAKAAADVEAARLAGRA